MGSSDESVRSGNSKQPAPGLEDVKDIVLNNFDERTWWATEALLATHASLRIKGVQRCLGMVVEGPSGAGKTTALRFFKSLDSVYRSDDVTPAAFVSHDASQSDSELKEIDLLPRIQHQTLIVPDMAGWFAGDKETIRERMGTVAKIMDGSGYQTDSGVHGRRGYEGDYRFALLGATTPLSPRARDVMGHTGTRLLFHFLPEKGNEDEIVDDVFGETGYREKVIECRKAVSEFYEAFDRCYGGYGSFEWEFEASEEIQSHLKYLAKIIRYSRAPVNQGSPQRESLYRPLASLRDMARGRALCQGRGFINKSDLQLCARVALSSMHQKRRPVVQSLLYESSSTHQASWMEEVAGVSRPTARDRMELMETLGIAECLSKGKNNTRQVLLKDEFAWPDGLSFPEAFHHQCRGM